MFPKIKERKSNFFPEIKETYMLSSMRKGTHPIIMRHEHNVWSA